MPTSVTYWAVGMDAAADSEFGHSSISGALLADWAPSLPPSAASSFLGWAPHLTQLHQGPNGSEYLCLNELAGRSERQWKSVMSWMLGISGARHVLALEGYTWIAPTSAFYANAVREVDLRNWLTPVFPPTRLTISKAKGKRGLLPDYVALKQAKSGRYGWALGEAKGTSANLHNMKVPPRNWKEQIENAVVELDGAPMKVPRRLIIATRANPNAVRPTTRQIQIRAWNSEADEPPLPQHVANDIVAASLFSLCCGLRLPANATAIAAGVESRQRARTHPAQIRSQLDTDAVQRLNDVAETELRTRLHAVRVGEKAWTRGHARLESAEQPVELQVEGPTVSLIRGLATEPNDDAVAESVQRAETQLDVWQTDKSARRSERAELDVAELPMGVLVSAPRRR